MHWVRSIYVAWSKHPRCFEIFFPLAFSSIYLTEGVAKYKIVAIVRKTQNTIYKIYNLQSKIYKIAI